MVKAFFYGFDLPRSITYTNMALIHKKDKVKRLEDLRLINLCNFVNKVFSKLVLDKLSTVITKIISTN